MSDVADALDEALAILRPATDLIGERPFAGHVPEWAARRGWSDFLQSIDDRALADAEAAPAAWLAAHAPGALGTLGRDALAFSSRFQSPSHEAHDVSQKWLVSEASAGGARHVKARKRVQIEAFVVAARGFEGVERVVDLGSGHGHLTRALGELVDAVGVERDRERVARARDLGGRFVAGEGAEARLRPGDLAVGLHPCGALGDDLVRGARSARAQVLMVSCCYQKTEPPERRWLARRAEGFAVPQHALGLANLAPVSFRGSGSLDAKRDWRRTRLAVRLALEARGVSLGPGDEARGVTKERFRRGLRAAADRAFARRSLSPPSGDELNAAERAAADAYGRVARFALPRHALARVLELAIVLDRATYLAEGGYRASVRPLFGLETSPRNLAVAAVPE